MSDWIGRKDRLFVSESKEEDILYLPSKEVIEINGEFTVDLDLFYTSSDLYDLFDFKKQNWVHLCSEAKTVLENSMEENEARKEAEMSLF